MGAGTMQAARRNYIVVRSTESQVHASWIVRVQVSSNAVLHEVPRRLKNTFGNFTKHS